MILRSTFLGLISLPLSAAVLSPPSVDPTVEWHLPAQRKAAAVDAETPWTATVEVPELTDKEKSAGDAWRGVLGFDLFGTADGKAGELRLEALDPATGEVFASSATKVSGEAPRAAWTVIASSEQGGSLAMAAFDGDPKTSWHSRYGGKKENPPHWIGLEFGKPQAMEGVSYLPRQEGFSNGVARKWHLEVRKPGGDWEKVAGGESDGKKVGEAREAVEIRFDEKLTVEAFRFVIESDWSGGGFGTAGEVTPIGVTLAEEEPVEASTRTWLEIPESVMEAVRGKSFGLRVSAAEGRVVVAQPHWCQVSTKPGGKLYGRSNGGAGPDVLGAGLLGFTAMTEHQQTVLPIVAVREGGPSANAGLVAGDAILSVGGKPLPVNDVNPGWNWFRQSHEAILGRESERALSAGEKSLELGVLRDGKIVPLSVELPRTRAFTTLDPASDPEAAALLDDMLAWVVNNQAKDGSWSGDMKRTTFGALALLATGKEEHKAAVKRAIGWSLKKYPAPEKHGNLGFWSGAYMGILYSEWYLHTGDERVLPHLDLMRDWAFDGQHECKWEVPSLGHGPNGIPYGQKALVAPACHLLVFEALAGRCGMDSKLWELLMPYMEMSWSDPKDGGHGAMGYNRSYKDLGEFWSRSGLFAMAAHLRGDRSDMRDAMTKIMEERHPWIRNSHAYGEPGGSLGLLGLNLAAPERFERVLKEYAWWFSMAWEPGYGLKFTQPHMGAPYMGADDLFNVCYALVLQAPKRNLHLTGLPAE
ncbi:hypothetical protein HAHE_08540 [Haloferula helveola]|uniref:PDZ domain-containing protein n=1 Tax=Haloferula helveola TaxID=490095 RepID=A0ABN6H080_9BACT|nr:hypothetical protein HAHE_08540 [Haloferula helveola]